MKALQIQPRARMSSRAILRQLCAAVSNLRLRIDARACLTVATAATVLFFGSLGAMNVTAIIISGLTALAAVAAAPMNAGRSESDKEGGAL